MTSITRLTFFFLCCLFSVGAVRADQEQELENLRKRIAAVQLDIDRASESKSEVADDLRESERAISTINRKLSRLTTQQRETDRKLITLNGDERQLRDALSAQQIRLAALLYQQYLHGTQGHLKIFLNSNDPNQLFRDLRYYHYIASDRAAWMVKLRTSLSSLAAVRKQASDKRDELGRLRAEQAKQKELLKVQQRSRQQLLKKISFQLRKQQREMKNLQRNEARLAQLVEKISDMLAQPRGNSVFRNDNLPDNRFDGRPFSQLKGKLARPVHGVVTNRFNTPRPDSTVPWKGIFLRTSGGQAVKTVAAGRVVFADWLRGFGNLLIVDHGNNFMSLYGYNETLYKEVGDELRGGDTIASVGNSGGNAEFGLYFEIRYKSKPLDPLQWLATR